MASRTLATCATCELHAEAVFRVEGMDCREEVVILERRLKPLAGLEAVTADLIGQKLHVQYDAAKLSTSTMVDAVGQTGMRMWLEHEEPLAQPAVVAARWRLLAASAVTLGSGIVFALAGASGIAGPLYLVSAALGVFYPARRALTALRSRSLDINVLMVIAAAGAVFIGEWLEAASVVFLFAVAQWLEVRTMDRARQAIRSLMDLAPREALVLRDGHQRRVAVEDVLVGERILVRPGDKIALDGRVVAGHSDVNEAPMTGESLPADKEVGAEVFAGTINGRGALDVEVTRRGRDTRLAHIIHLVETAQSERAPVQGFVDRFAAIYTPVVVAVAIAVAILPWLFGSPDAGGWVYRALVLLVIACPCALVISTPVSIVAALSAAARHGVLIKGGAHLERLAAVRLVAFDKTGTLTRGALRVTDVLPLGRLDAGEIVRIAAAIEARSAHPVATAVVAYARGQHLAPLHASGFSSFPGLGAEGEVEGRHVLVGNDRLMAARGVALPVTTAAAADVAAWAASPSRILVAVDGVAVGVLAIADQPRDTAREAIGLLREQGVRRVVMLTGDNRETAARVGAELGVDDVHADLLPEQKHALVQSLRRAGQVVMMVGDGVNDAPALAAADVGAAMGAAGSDAALETADVALMSDELLKLPYVLRLARATVRNVKVNVAISLLLKLAFLVMAITGVATLWMAVLADTGATLIVVANALRLLRAR